MSFPGGTTGKEPPCQSRRHKRHEFNPCLGKILWRRAWQPTPGESTWTEELGRLQSTAHYNTLKYHAAIIKSNFINLP